MGAISSSTGVSIRLHVGCASLHSVTALVFVSFGGRLGPGVLFSQTVDSLNHSSVKVYLSTVRSLHIHNGLPDPLINCLQLQQLQSGGGGGGCVEGWVCAGSFYSQASSHHY